MEGKQSVDRRGFLTRLPILPAAAAALSGVATGCAGVPFVTGRPVAAGIALSPSVFGEGPDVIVETPNSRFPIYVRRSSDGYTAVSLRCTHRGCQAEPEADRLACPCHGSEFSFDGRVLRGPAEEPLSSYKTRIENELIVIESRADSPQ